MLVIKGGKSEILSSLRANSKEKLVFIKSKVSISILAEILNKTGVRRIIFSNGVYKTLPKSALPALKEVGIRITVKELRKGKRSKYRQKTFEKMFRMHKKGIKPAEVAKALGMPLTTLYYYMRRKNI